MHYVVYLVGRYAPNQIRTALKNVRDNTHRSLFAVLCDARMKGCTTALSSDLHNGPDGRLLVLQTFHLDNVSGLDYVRPTGETSFRDCCMQTQTSLTAPTDHRHQTSKQAYSSSWFIFLRAIFFGRGWICHGHREQRWLRGDAPCPLLLLLQAKSAFTSIIDSKKASSFFLNQEPLGNL